MNKNSPAANTDKGRYVLVSLLLTLASATTYLAPVAISAMSIRYALSASGAGTLVTVELVCSAITALSLASYLRTANIARLVLITATLTLLGHVLSSLNLSLPAFVAVRMTTGLSYGACYAIACYLASQSPASVRIVSVAFLTSSVVYGGGLFFLLPAVAEYGPGALFAPLAVFALLTLIAVASVGNLPRYELPADAQGASKLGRRKLWLLLGTCAFGNGSLQMLWTFSQRVAEARQFDINVTAAVLSASVLFNILGSVATAMLDRRWGMGRPLVLGLLGGVVSGVIVGASATVTGFAGGFLLYGFATFFVLPYLFGAGAVLDDTGRVATLGGATIYMAGAVSPLIGGLIADFVSLAAVGWAAAAACLAAALYAWALRGDLDKEEPALATSTALKQEGRA